MDRAKVESSEKATGLSFDLVTIDGDTAVLATFWSLALGLVEMQREDEGRWIVLGTHGGVRRIGLQSGEPCQGGIHLDLTCSSTQFATEVNRLISLGARLRSAPRTEPFGLIVNLEDPEGNRFDLCAYTPPDERREARGDHRQRSRTRSSAWRLDA